MTRPTYGRFTLDYVERTGPVDRVGVVLTDGFAHLDAGSEDDAADICEAAKALAARANDDEATDWDLTSPTTAEAIFTR